MALTTPLQASHPSVSTPPFFTTTARCFARTCVCKRPLRRAVRGFRESSSLGAARRRGAASRLGHYIDELAAKRRHGDATDSRGHRRAVPRCASGSGGPSLDAPNRSTTWTVSAQPANHPRAPPACSRSPRKGAPASCGPRHASIRAPHLVLRGTLRLELAAQGCCQPRAVSNAPPTHTHTHAHTHAQVYRARIQQHRGPVHDGRPLLRESRFRARRCARGAPPLGRSVFGADVCGCCSRSWGGARVGFPMPLVRRRQRKYKARPWMPLPDPLPAPPAAYCPTLRCARARPEQEYHQGRWVFARYLGSSPLVFAIAAAKSRHPGEHAGSALLFV